MYVFDSGSEELLTNRVLLGQISIVLRNNEGQTREEKIPTSKIEATISSKTSSSCNFGRVVNADCDVPIRLKGWWNVKNMLYVNDVQCLATD